MIRKSVKKTGSVKMRLCRPHFSNFADLFGHRCVLPAHFRCFGCLLGALLERVRMAFFGFGRLPGPPAGPGRLPGTILVCFSRIGNHFQMIFGMDLWLLPRTAKTGFELWS